MNRDLNKNRNFLLNLICFSFVFTVVYVIGNVIQLDINVMYRILIVIASISLVKFLINHPIILPATLIVTLIISALVNRYVKEFLPSALNRIIYLFTNIIENLKGNQEIFQENILWFWIIVVFIFSVFTCYFIFKNNKPWILLFIYLPVFIYYWYIFFDESLYFMAIFLMSFIVFIGLNAYRKEENKLLQSPGYDLQDVYPNWRKTVLRYAILIIFLAIIIPKNTDYISWPWLNRKTTSIFPQIEELRSSEKYSRRSGEATIFDFSSTGFMGEDKRLGGPVELSDKVVMTVLTPKSIYLRGNVKEEYTGYNWVTNKKSYENYSLGQDFSGLSIEERSLYYEQEDITITNELFASTTLFSPYKPYKVFSNDKYSIEIERNYILKASNGVYKDESYLVRVQTPLPYGKLKAAGIDKKKTDLENLDYYLQLPDNISDRTVALTDEIVLEKITVEMPTDFKKALAIESYLRKNYPYNLKVEELPANSEFVDYFLFEGKEGYCTYYATAMAIMLRIENIPSRYIEGYLVKDSIEDGKYEVSQKNAHAWVEAFIEPVGWMTFEATPQYSISPRYENYSITDSEIDERQERDDIELEDFEDLGGKSDDSDEDQEDDGVNIYTQAPSDGELNYQYTLFTVIAIIISLIILNILRNIWHIVRNKKNFKTLSQSKRIIYLYKDILDMVSQLGYPQKSGETHFEYADRINYKFYDIKSISIKEITDIFVRSKYSSYNPSDSDINILFNYKKEIEDRLKNNLGKIKYYYRKYIKIGK